MRFWGTENNVSRPGKTARATRQRAPKSRAASRDTGRSGQSGASAASTAGKAGGRTSGARRSVAAGGNVRNYPFLRQFYRHQTAINGRLQRVLFFLVISTLIYVFVLGDNGVIRIAQLRLERARLDANIAELEQSSQRLENTIERLKKDDFYIEKIGRERYGYVGRGERVYKIIPVDDRNY